MDGIDSEVIQKLYKNQVIDEDGLLKEKKINNEYYILNKNSNSVLARYNGENKKN